MRFESLEEVDPVFVPDVVADGGQQEVLVNCLYYEKSGRSACVETADGKRHKGIILPRAVISEFLSRHGVANGDKRPKCIVWRADDDFDVIEWADVVDVSQAK